MWKPQQPSADSDSLRILRRQGQAQQTSERSEASAASKWTRSEVLSLSKETADSALFRTIAPLLLFLLLAACTPTNGVDRPPAYISNADAVALRPVSTPGERIRTRKRLVVREILPRGDQANITLDESYVQTARSVDSSGRPVHVLRSYERYESSVSRPGAEPVIEHSPLEGSEIELIERVAGVSARVISGRADPAQLTGLLISGFETRLLPAQLVSRGSQWTVDATQQQDMAGVFRALGMTPARSTVTCLFVALDSSQPPAGDNLAQPPARIARVTLDWTVTGAVLDNNETFRLSGELWFDLDRRIVSRLELAGGKVQPGGSVAQQISMELTREPAKGWWE